MQNTPLYIPCDNYGWLRRKDAKDCAESWRRYRPRGLLGNLIEVKIPLCLAPFKREEGFPGATTRRCGEGLDARSGIWKCSSSMSICPIQMKSVWPLGLALTVQDCSGMLKYIKFYSSAVSNFPEVYQERLIPSQDFCFFYFWRLWLFIICGFTVNPNYEYRQHVKRW